MRNSSCCDDVVREMNEAVGEVEEEREEGGDVEGEWGYEGVGEGRGDGRGEGEGEGVEGRDEDCSDDSFQVVASLDVFDCYSH